MEAEGREAGEGGKPGEEERWRDGSRERENNGGRGGESRRWRTREEHVKPSERKST